jgi:hypothetical protein
MTLTAGILIWFAVLAAVAMIPAWTGVGVVIAGIALPLPAWIDASPLSRGLLACFLGATFIRAIDLSSAGTVVGFRARLAHLCSYFDTQKVQRVSRGAAISDFVRLTASTAVFAVALAVAKPVPPSGLFAFMRWLAGGVGMLAIAEMATACHSVATSLFGLTAPPIFRSPFLSTTLAEFWARRWNVPASEALHRYGFALFARRSASFALFFAFFLSALGHAAIVLLALRSRWLAAACGAFFLLQALLILVERRLNVHRWRPSAARVWTWSMLAVTMPLVVEPLLRMAERVWGSPDEIAKPTIAVLGFCTAIAILTSLAALASQPGGSNARSCRLLPPRSTAESSAKEAPGRRRWNQDSV